MTSSLNKSSLQDVFAHMAESMAVLGVAVLPKMFLKKPKTGIITRSMDSFVNLTKLQNKQIQPNLSHLGVPLIEVEDPVFTLKLEDATLLCLTKGGFFFCCRLRLLDLLGGLLDLSCDQSRYFGKP